jgi:recombination DNA repair RAD52 pathway protein
VLVVGACRIADYGAGHGIDSDLGAAIESAIKEAATDSLKRCCKTLGDRLGLALYDKQQRNVADAAPAGADPVAFESLTIKYRSAKTRADWEAAKAAMTAMWPSMTADQQAAMTATINSERARIAQKAA